MKWFAKLPLFFSAHEGKFPIRCKHCPELFEDLTQRIKHMRFYHSASHAEQFKFPQVGEKNHVLYFLKRFFFKTIGK